MTAGPWAGCIRHECWSRTEVRDWQGLNLDTHGSVLDYHGSVETNGHSKEGGLNFRLLYCQAVRLWSLG